MATSTTLNQAPVKMGGFRAWWVWALATTFVVFLFNVQTGYSIVNPNVQQDVGLTLAQVSLVASIYTWAFAICQFFGGALLDKLGARTVLVPAIALVTLGVWVFSIADSFGMLLLSQVILAIGSCVGFVGAGYVGGQWFGMAKYGIMFGWVQTVAALSSAFGQTVISLALQDMSWRELADIAVVVGIVLFLLSLVWIRNPQPVARSSGNVIGDVLSNLGHIAKIPHMWVAGIWGAVSFGSQLALGVVWAPKILAAHGLTGQAANLGSAMVWLGLAIGCLFWNPWSEHSQSRKTPAVIGLVLQLVALALVLFMPLQGAVAIALMLVYGIGSAGHMIAFSTAADVVTPDKIGTSAAFINGAMFIMGGLLVALPGYMLAATGTLADYRSAFMPLIGLLVVAIVLALVQKETFQKHTA